MRDASEGICAPALTLLLSPRSAESVLASEGASGARKSIGGPVTPDGLQEGLRGLAPAVEAAANALED